MSDSNAYINAYIDHSVGMIHENIAAILQLKTQLKIALDLSVQKDAVIGNLSSELESFKTSSNNNTNELRTLKEEARVLKEQNHALTNKTSHMEGLMNQVNEMKSMVQHRDIKIAELEKIIEDIKTTKTPEVVINKKNRKSVKTETISVVQEKDPTDDF